MEAARELAYVLHEQNISLVYGGGSIGIMGELARSLFSLSGPRYVHGINPKALLAHERDNNGTDPVVEGEKSNLWDYID